MENLYVQFKGKKTVEEKVAFIRMHNVQDIVKEIQFGNLSDVIDVFKFYRDHNVFLVKDEQNVLDVFLNINADDLTDAGKFRDISYQVRVFLQSYSAEEIDKILHGATTQDLIDTFKISQKKIKEAQYPLKGKLLEDITSDQTTATKADMFKEAYAMFIEKRYREKEMEKKYETVKTTVSSTTTDKENFVKDISYSENAQTVIHDKSYFNRFTDKKLVFEDFERAKAVAQYLAGKEHTPGYIFQYLGFPANSNFCYTYFLNLLARLEIEEISGACNIPMVFNNYPELKNLSYEEKREFLKREIKLDRWKKLWKNNEFKASRFLSVYGIRPDGKGDNAYAKLDFIKEKCLKERTKNLLDNKESLDEAEVSAVTPTEESVPAVSKVEVSKLAAVPEVVKKSVVNNTTFDFPSGVIRETSQVGLASDGIMLDDIESIKKLLLSVDGKKFVKLTIKLEVL